VEVIGIAKDAKYESVREETLPTVFRPQVQTPLEDQAESFEVRTAVPQGALPQGAMRKAIENAVAAVDREIPIEIDTLTEQVEKSMTRERVLAALSAFFGGLALLLATIGLYEEATACGATADYDRRLLLRRRFRLEFSSPLPELFGIGSVCSPRSLSGLSLNVEYCTVSSSPANIFRLALNSYVISLQTTFGDCPRTGSFKYQDMVSRLKFVGHP
jgi:hypothetical protein